MSEAKKYFSYHPEWGFELHNTAEEAKKAAEDYLDTDRDQACDGWPEGVEQICWGELRQHIVETVNRPRSGDDLLVSPEFDTVVDYGLADVDEELEKPESIIDQLNKPIRTEVINGLTLEYDILGGVNIKIEDFVYVHINYDHRYTHNSARKELAEKIAGLISGKENQLPEPAAWINKNQLKFTTDIYEAQDWINEGDHVVHYYAGPPARSPMPDVEISKAFCDEAGMSIGDTIEDAFEAGVRFGEQYHGIKEQE